MARITPQAAGGINRVAYLDMLAFGEIGLPMLRASDDGYNVCVGSTPSKLVLFSDYSTHPRIYNKAVNSTAAGRYQLLARYWTSYQMLLHLPDFSPISQDKVALQMLKEQKALAAIDKGAISVAIQLTNDIWASLPGSPYGQRTANSPSLDAFINAYQAAGGTLA